LKSVEVTGNDDWIGCFEERKEENPYTQYRIRTEIQSTKAEIYDKLSNYVK
jgi:hypothetical protein